MAFENIIGNEKIKAILTSAVSDQNILHSYLFVGIEGIGKSLFAKEFAKMILCMENENKPCKKCKSCIEYASSNHPDFMLIQPEDGKNIKIEQIRYLQEKIAEKPVTSSKKVYIIDEAQTMTREAANCLLKTLEEPPEYAVLILLTSNESKLLTTIKSRCIKIYFMPIANEQVVNYLKQNKLDANITNAMIKESEGSIGRIIKILEEKEKYIQIEEIINKLQTQNITKVWLESEVLYKSKENIIPLLEYMIVVLYENLKKEDKISYANGINIIEEAKQRILSNANYDMTIDNMLLKLWEELF